MEEKRGVLEGEQEVDQEVDQEEAKQRKRGKRGESREGKVAWANVGIEEYLLEEDRVNQGEDLDTNVWNSLKGVLLYKCVCGPRIHSILMRFRCKEESSG